MIPRKINFVPGKIKMKPRRYATIVENMVISLMIVPNHPSSTRSKKIMTIDISTRRIMKIKITRRRSSSREKKETRPSLESGSPMVKPQAMMMTRKSSWVLPFMMMNHFYLHHPCVSWQEVTPK